MCDRESFFRACHALMDDIAADLSPEARMSLRNYLFKKQFAGERLGRTALGYLSGDFERRIHSRMGANDKWLVQRFLDELGELHLAAKGMEPADPF